MTRAVSQIAVGVLVQVLAISCWFATAAAVPSLTVAFGLGPIGRVLLVVAVQAGFAVGAVVVGLTRLCDRLPPALLVSLGSAATAAMTVLPLVDDSSFELLLASRVGVGLLLATVYPAGMRATVSWASPRWRGLAVAGVVAALTLGTAAPWLLDASPVEDWRQVLVVCALAAGASALLALTLRSGPYVTTGRQGDDAARTDGPHSAGSGAVDSRIARSRIAGSRNPLRRPGQRRITLAYVGHMWEVYGLWVWLPALLLAIPSLAPRDAGGSTGLLAFVLIGVVGALGCLAGGVLASRYGKRVVARWSVVISTACAASTPLLPEAPAVLAVLLLALWSASAIADSPLYSALTGDEADPDQVGSAIALQMGIGYLASIGAISGVLALAELVGWRYAFLPLAIGPLIAAIALRPGPWWRMSAQSGTL
ncbi:MFS transporter [Plantibacter sp. Mn2098]|uniref:MFS transporter n=1 Tax=Plantibacter sp. Mn2098 TaxID=3395266 RepID=UPI003BDAB416